jgi:DNA-directed RNA polymerase subunit beta'
MERKKQKLCFQVKILFKHGDNSLVPMVSQEYVYGLAKLSEKGKKTGKKFDSIKEAREAGLHFTDVFELDGKEMTLGQAMINQKIPKEYRNYDQVYNKKNTGALLSKIGREKPEAFAEALNNFKDLGSMYSYKKGMTLSLDDFKIDRSFRDKLVKEKLPKIEAIKDKDKRIQAYADFVDELEEAQNKSLEGSGNNIVDLLGTGALGGGKAKNVRQVLTAPGMLVDVKERPIDRLFLKSYSEGLDTGDYLATMPGVRKGVVNKAISTQDSGALNKSLLSVNRRYLVTEEDCGTDKGIELEVGDKNIIDRALLYNITGVGRRNDIVDSDM